MKVLHYLSCNEKEKKKKRRSRVYFLIIYQQIDVQSSSIFHYQQTTEMRERKKVARRRIWPFIKTVSNKNKYRIVLSSYNMTCIQMCGSRLYTSSAAIVALLLQCNNSAKHFIKHLMPEIVTYH